MQDKDLTAYRSRYVRLFGEEPVTEGVICTIEQVLDITLPDDLKKIASFYCGGIIGGVSHNALAAGGAATSVVDETLRLRETIGLPRRFVVLAEPSESLIVLDCVSSDQGGPAVIWCDGQDVSRLGTPESMSAPETWASYGSFFSHLLDEEEDEREEI